VPVFLFIVLIDSSLTNSFSGTPPALLLMVGCSPEYAEFASDMLMIHEYVVPSPMNLLRAFILLYTTPEFVPKNFELAAIENGLNKKQIYRVCQRPS
jgi:hypothetical protein